MKRAGIVLVLAVLLLSGCAAGSQMEKSDTASVQEMTETHESTGTSEDKGAKAPDQVSDVVSDSVNEKVNDSVNEIVAGSVESPMESAVADIRQLSKQDESSSKSDREPEKADASSQAVDSDASEARESKEESAAVSRQEEYSREETKETTTSEETSDEKTVTEESDSGPETESETDDLSEAVEETEKSEPEKEPDPESEPEQTFDIGYWIAYAKQCAVDHGLNLDSSATDCWDNPITANASCIYLERDLNARMNWYASMEDVTDVWIWYEDLGNERYLIYIGYA